MVRFECRALLDALRELEKVRIRAEGGKSNNQELQHSLGVLSHRCEGMPFPPSIMGNFRRALPPNAFATTPELVALVKNLEQGVLEEMSAFAFFAVPPVRVAFYDVTWASPPILMTFHDSVPDLRNAGRCYAFGQWTASAFHLMRVLEKAFRALARRLDAQLELKEDLDYADWAALDRACRKRYEVIQQTQRGKDKSDELEFLAKCGLELGYFGNAWRHNICHGRANYDADSAKELLDRVKSFLELLAPKL